MSQPPGNPAQEAQELTVTPPVEPKQGSTLMNQAQESLQAVKRPRQNREDKSELYEIINAVGDLTLASATVTPPDDPQLKRALDDTEASLNLPDAEDDF